HRRELAPGCRQSGRTGSGISSLSLVPRRGSKRLIGDDQRQLKQLLACFCRQRLIRRGGSRRGMRQSLLDLVHIKSSCVAPLETVQHLARLLDLSGLIVEDAKGGVASRPLGEQVNRAFEAF